MEPILDPGAQTLKRALFAVRDLTSRLEALQKERSEPIAVIGMSCRFPGAGSLGAFWDLLRNGVDAIGEVPRSRWDVDRYYDANQDAAGKCYTRSGGFLDDVEMFDAQFFGISPREAMEMDPQQRMLLEVAWEALEDAALAPGLLDGQKAGVFTGITTVDYLTSGYSGVEQADAYRMTGGLLNFAAGRIAHALGLRGPVLSVDTACASSLTALHLACQSLRAGECRTALAAGVNLIASPELNVLVARTKALSPDGRCKTFDASADGMGRAEGCGVVVMKRLSDALKAGDRIACVIRGSAVSHDGRSGGFTVPNPGAQEALIREALENARVQPKEISYVEAHGTGTALGDPIEMAALAAVFASEKSDRDKLLVGSVKTNIGHAESAAGMAGLIKVALCMRHRTIVPHLHLKNPSPHIPWDKLPFEVPTQAQPWNPVSGRRIAGLSGFGMSGTIAHVVIEEPPTRELATAGNAPGPHVFAFSAKTSEALRELAARYRAHLAEAPDTRLDDFCYTVNTGRAHWPKRAAIVFDSITEACAKLSEIESGATDRRKDAHHSEVAEKYRSGAPVDWASVYNGRNLRKVAAPSYPFQRQHYWIERNRVDRKEESLSHPLLGRRLESPTIRDIVFERRFSAVDPGFLSDHKVYGTTVVSGTTYFEMALAAANHAWGEQRYALEDVAIREAMVLVDEDPRTVQILIRPDERESGTWEIFSRELDGARPWTLHAAGRVRAARGDVKDPAPSTLAQAQSQCPREMPREEYYAVLRARGLEHGPLFANIERLWRGEQESLGLVDVPEALRPDLSGYTFHPAVLDACFQVVGAASNDLFERHDDAYVTVGFDAFHLYSAIEPKLWCSATLRPMQDGSVVGGDLRVFSDSGRLLAESQGILFRRVAAGAFERLAGKRTQSASSYTIDWESKPLATSEPVTAGRWFIAADTGGASSILAGTLEERGGSCTLVYPSAPAAELREELAAFLVAGRTDSNHVVFVWDSECPNPLQSNCTRLLTLAQTILGTDLARLPELQIVTGDPVEESVAWGFARCLGLERPELRCSCLELNAADPAGKARELLQELIHRDGENQVAIRDGKRLAPRLKPVPRTSAVTKPELRADATYLITGGLGDLGLEVAKWMARRGAGSIALMGRSEPSNAAAWVVEEIRTAGTKVLTIQCDVANEPELSAALESIGAQLGPLRGVVHAAGVLEDAAVENQTWARYAKVFAPKVQGAWNLHRLTLGKPLDFFVLFSSAACLLGSPGQTNYAAANAYLDALARHRKSLGMPALSIDWGPWKETGMTAGSAGASRWRESGISGMSPAEALEKLEVLLGQPAIAQAAVLSVDWATLAEAIPATRQIGLFETVLRDARPASSAKSSRGPELLEKLEQIPLAGKRKAVFDYVREQVRRVMRIDASLNFDERQPLNELGLDSLMAVELKTTLGNCVGRTLSAGLLFLYPNMHALAEYLATDVLALPAATQAREPDEKAARSEMLLEEIELLSDDELDAKLAEIAELNPRNGERKKGIAQ
jgi:acyl transferase domain-containing protein